MRRLVLLAAAALAAQAAAAGPPPEDASASDACETGLARTLAVMEARPLMKEEAATGLMWLRLDAAAALKRDDGAACLRKLAAVESILGLDGTSRTQAR